MFENDKMEDIITILNNGGLILYPTDTIWGIGCDATNEAAIRKIYRLKQRELSKPFVLLADSLDMIEEHVEEVAPKIDNLLRHHTRPLTVIYEKGRNLPTNAMAEDGSVAIRVVMDDFCKHLISEFGKPLVSTSANISNMEFPVNFGTISSDIIQGVDYVVKWRQNEKGGSEPSVVVRMSKKGELIFIRE